MRTDPITIEALGRSVIAVPPLARTPDLRLAPAANAALLQHLEAGGVRSVLYGGNANLYHIGLGDYADLLHQLADAAGSDTWILPSVGPDYGKAMEQAAILKRTAYPTAMLLPMMFPFSGSGLVDGIRRFTDALGRPAIVYIKSEPYIAPDALAALMEEGRVCALKYAVKRGDPGVDAYLEALITVIDRKRIVSGDGERPAAVHVSKFGLNGYTSGSACLAPRLAMALLQALQAGDTERAAAIRERFMPMEDVRDRLGPIVALHDAVTLSGVADMGAIQPMLSNLPAVDRERVLPVVQRLMAEDAVHGARQAA